MLGMNSFVHVFLYFYYGQSALYPTQRPQWRKTLTQLQMFQFIVGIVHSSFGYAHHGFCIFSIFYGFSMLGLFGNFYFHAYIKARHDKKSEWAKVERFVLQYNFYGTINFNFLFIILDFEFLFNKLFCVYLMYVCQIWCSSREHPLNYHCSKLENHVKNYLSYQVFNAAKMDPINVCKLSFWH